MRPEFLAGWALAVEAVEDRGQLVLGDAGALIFDSDENRPSVEGGGDADLALRRAERDRIGDDVEKNLRGAAFGTRDDDGTAPARRVYCQCPECPPPTRPPGRPLALATGC